MIYLFCNLRILCVFIPIVWSNVEKDMEDPT